MLESVFLMGGLGFVIGGVLAFASKIFYVYVDPKIVAIEDVLPGANCGGCGFPGCTPNAEAIVFRSSHCHWSLWVYHLVKKNLNLLFQGAITANK